MKTYTLEREIRIPRPLDDVFPFFANAENLQRLTPPWMSFRILSPVPIQMRVGVRIDYQLRVRGIPIRWTSEITAWDPPHRFVDEQRRGPYRQWIHEHTFEADGTGTVVRDRVQYAVPGGPLVHRFLVAPDLEKVFDYRLQEMERVFGEPNANGEVVSPGA